MLTTTERHIAQALQAQLDELERISQARDDLEWQRLMVQTQRAMLRIKDDDPELYALLTTEIPLTPKGIRLCAQQAARDQIRGRR